MRLVYLFGPPASGKSTVLDLALEIMEIDLKPEADRYWHRLKHNGGVFDGVYLGKRREKFSGTDALAMNALPHVLEALAKFRPALVVGEGDRLANDRFFRECQQMGYELRLVYLTAPIERLRKRDLQRGSEQSDSWRKGRITKAARLASRWHHTKLNATMPPEMLARNIAQEIGAG